MPGPPPNITSSSRLQLSRSLQKQCAADKIQTWEVEFLWKISWGKIYNRHIARRGEGVICQTWTRAISWYGRPQPSDKKGYTVWKKSWRDFENIALHCIALTHKWLKISILGFQKDLKGFLWHWNGHFRDHDKGHDQRWSYMKKQISYMSYAHT